MSVYTEVSAAELQVFLRGYETGELQDLTGIRAGIENTNYLVSTCNGDYVLTLFEHSTPAEVMFALECMSWFARHGLPCAPPLRNQQGHLLGQLHGKPASLVPCLPGQSVHQPGVEHCRAVGRALAELHLAGLKLPQPRANPRGADWRRDMADRLRQRLEAGQRALLDDELAFQQQNFRDLPRGVIHADLFRDNVLFNGGKLTGLLDLYHAGRDLLLYDLAITVNDWCRPTSSGFDGPRLCALLQAYTALRPVTAAEQQAWPVLLRRAALRYWLSRLYHLHFPRAGQLTQPKDPGVYLQLLQSYRAGPPDWPG